MLFEIGNGYAPPEVVCRDFSNEMVPLKKACRNAVLEGLNLYLAEIKDKNSIARSQALELLTSLEERADVVRDKLKELLSAEEGEFHDKVAEILQKMA